jgi:TolB-like protein
MRKFSLLIAFAILSGHSPISLAEGAGFSLPYIPVVGVSARSEYRGVLGRKNSSYSPSSSSGTFNSNTMFLAAQLDANTDAAIRGNITFITTITDLNTLSQSVPMGRLISEHLAHHLKVRGWKITEPRLTKEVQMTPSGEFVLSRDPAQLIANFGAHNVLTGTYAVTSDGVLVNLRIVDFQTREVISTAQTRIPLDPFTVSLLAAQSPDRQIARVSIAR